MNVDFKQVFSVLYEQFGDQAIAWTQKTVVSYLDAQFDGNEVTDVRSTNESQNAEDRSGSSEGEPWPSEKAQIDEGSIYEDGEAFAAGVGLSVQNLASDAIQSPTQVVDAVMGLVVLAGEVRKFEEAQVSKRLGIAADRDVAIAQINAQRELLQDYLERSFDERADNFSKLFAVVDRALDTHDMTALALGLESVVQLATSSQFKDLRTVEETAAALANPDHEWDF